MMINETASSSGRKPLRPVFHSPGLGTNKLMGNGMWLTALCIDNLPRLDQIIEMK